MSSQSPNKRATRMEEPFNPYERKSYQLTEQDEYERNAYHNNVNRYQHENINPNDATEHANPYDRRSYQESANPYDRKTYQTLNPDSQRKSYSQESRPSYTSTPQESRKSYQSWSQDERKAYSPSAQDRRSTQEKSYSNSPKLLPTSPQTYQSSSPKKSYSSPNPQYTTPINSSYSSPNPQESSFNPYEQRKPTHKSPIISPQSFGNEQRKSTYDSPNLHQSLNPYDKKLTTDYNQRSSVISSRNSYDPRQAPDSFDQTKSNNPYEHGKTKSNSSSNPYDSGRKKSKADYIPQNGSKSPKIIINDDPIIPDYIIQKTFKKQANYNMKIVVVGDGGCGKTCLLVAYAQNKFPEIYVPTVFENYVTNVLTPNNKILELALWDTAGQEEYDRLRPLSYPDVDVILICFALDNLISLQNVKDIWFPEINHFCPGIPIILVGTKSDLPSEIEPDLPMQLATEINAIGYIQCSAKNMFNIKTIFNFACNHYQKQMELQEQLEKSSKHRLSKVLGNNKSVDSSTHSRKRSSISKGHFKNTSYDSTLLLDQPLQEDDYSQNPYGNFGSNKVNAPKYNEDEFAFTRKNEKKKKKCVIL